VAGSDLKFVPPMIPTLVEQPPSGDDWLHELKYDGYRTQLVISPTGVLAFTRAGQDWTARYGPLIEAANELSCRAAVLDGEVIVQDSQGRPDFNALAHAIASAPERLIFMAFDLLYLDGRDLVREPLEARRGRLEQALGESGPARPIQFSAHVEGGGPDFFRAVDALGLEGVVSKKRGSRYRSGCSKSWLKTRAFAEGEFVVVAVERGEKTPVATLARESDAGLELAGPAWVTLAEPERERFWSAVEGLKTTRAAVSMERPKEGSFIEPELRVRARYLRGGATLRHATLQRIVGSADSAAASLKAIPGSAKPGGEPSYKKPKLPEKRAILEYYQQMAPFLLKHAGRRPLNLFRCTAGHCFYQRNRNHPAGTAFEAPIRFLAIEQKNGRTEDYLYVDDGEGVIASAEADAIEFHGWGSLVDDVERPDRIAFDLDPGEGVGFEAVKEAALRMRSVLDELDLASFPLLTGGKGIHVVVPLTPAANWNEVREFARRLCTALAGAEPRLFTVSLPKADRKGRIFLDYLRNQRSATAILPWSLRARPGAPVAAPVGWDEVPGLAHAARFTFRDAELLVRRARRRELRGWGEAMQRLPHLR
jgi:bifunctional non-homologous end joining protein LigD